MRLVQASREVTLVCPRMVRKSNQTTRDAHESCSPGKSCESGIGQGEEEEHVRAHPYLHAKQVCAHAQKEVG